MYRYNMIPTINKRTRVGKNSATAIDHIRGNCIVDRQFKTAVLKTDVTHHFPIAMALKTDEPLHQSQKVQNVQKRNYDERNVTTMNVTTMNVPSNHFNNVFVKLTGDNLKNAKIPTKNINIFLKHFSL